MKKRLLVVFFGMCLVLILGLTVFSARADVFRALDPKTGRMLDEGALDPKIGRTLDEDQPEPQVVGVVVDESFQYERCICPKIVRIIGPPDHIQTP